MAAIERNELLLLQRHIQNTLSSPHVKAGASAGLDEHMSKAVMHAWIRKHSGLLHAEVQALLSSAPSSFQSQLSDMLCILATCLGPLAKHTF
jgi:hypothetical protein